MARSHALVLAAGLTISLLGTACGGDIGGENTGGNGAGAGSAGGAGGTSSTGGMGGAGGSDVGPQPLEAPDKTWTWIELGDTHCRDGSPAGIGLWLNPESDRVIVYLESGGACWSDLTCLQAAEAYTEEDFFLNGFQTGIFNQNHPDNRLAGYNAVFVPYCTGDVFAGSRADGVGPDGSPQMFVGYENMKVILQRLVPTFPDAQLVALMGASSGGFGAGAVAELFFEAFPDKDVAVVDDSGPIVRPPAASECLQDVWRETWGFEDSFLAECGSACPDESDYFADYALHVVAEHPDRRMGVIASRQDETIRLFFGFGTNMCAEGASPLPQADLEAALDGFAEEVADIPNFGLFYLNDTQHIWLRRDNIFTTKVKGVAMIDWLADFLDGNVTQVRP